MKNRSRQIFKKPYFANASGGVFVERQVVAGDAVAQNVPGPFGLPCLGFKAAEAGNVVDGPYNAAGTSNFESSISVHETD